MDPWALTAKPKDLSSTPQVPLLWGPHTWVSEQRWADLQVSLLPEPRAVFLYVHLKEALSPPPSMLSTSQSERLSQGLQGTKGIRHRGKGGGDWELTDNALFSIPVSRLAGGI